MPRGRPTTITPEAIDAICNELDFGMSWNDACALAGINESTARRWRETGHQQADEGKETVFTEFWRRVNEARGNARKRALATVMAGETGQRGTAWQSGAWFLERHDYQNWGQRTAVDLSNKDGTLRRLVWPWEADEGTEDSAAPVASSAGNGGPEPKPVPRARVRKALGKNGSKRNGGG